MPKEFSTAAEVAIAEYLERTDGGESVDRESFLADHADVADELRSFFANDELVEELVDDVGRTVGPERGPGEAVESDTVLGSRGLDETTDGAPRLDTVLTELTVPGRFGRYELQKLLGEGAMGSVYLARDSQLGRKVALKIPKVESEASADFHERFLREARAAATLSHPNICSVHDVGEIDGTHFISMAFVEGHPLSDYIGGKLQPVRQALKLVRKLAAALAEAHANGVVHRDLKPDNVMVSKKGEPVVMDFGLARHAESGDLRATASGGLMGTPAYMSPEQVDGQSERIGPLSDQYSLGVVLYELLTGDIPFNGSLASVLGQIVNTDAEPPTKVRPEIPPEVEAVCLKMMAKQQGDRFDSLSDVADAIGALLKGETRLPDGDGSTETPTGETRMKTRDSVESSGGGHRRTAKETMATGPQTTARKTKTGKSKTRKSVAKTSAKLDQAAAAVDERKQHVEALLEAWKFREASAELRDLATDPELLDWVRAKQAEAKQGPKKARENSEALAATARQLLEKHDFAGAVEITDDVPREFRTPAFVEVRREAEAKLEKAGNMEFEIEQLLLDRQYDDLEKPVKKLLAFQPTNRLARKLQAAMEGTVTSGSRMDVHGVKVELDDLKRSSDSIFAGFLPIAIGVVVVFGALTWGAMHLLWAAPSLTAKFAIDAALLDGSYEFLVDGKERKPDEMQDGLKGMAAGVHEIVVKKDGEVVARVNVEVPADEAPTIHITLKDGRVIVSTELPRDDDTKIADGTDPPGTDTLATAVPITIPANSKAGYPIGRVSAGTTIELQYVSGKWKGWGSQPDISPDKTDGRGEGSGHLVLADLGDGSGDGKVVVTVPEGTAEKPFVHVLAEDAENLVLRIKDRGDGWDGNPGKVQYKALVAGTSLGGARASTTPDEPPVEPQVGNGFAARETLPPVDDPTKLKPGLVVCEFARPQVQFVQDVKNIPRPSEYGSPVTRARVIPNVDKWKFDEKRNALATGYLKIDDAGTYEFNANSFYDRAELYVDGKRVCKYRDGERTFTKIDLQPGYVPFVAVGNVWARGYCEIRWKTPGNGSATTIPANRLFHDPADVAKIDADYEQAEREFAAQLPPPVDVDTTGLDPWLVRRTAPRLPSQMPKVVTIPLDNIVAKLNPGTERQKELEGFKPDVSANTVVIGYLKVTTPGRHYFVTWAWNDAIELYVGGKRVCRKGDDGLTVGWVDLQPGLVPLVYVAYPTVKGAPDFFWRPPTQRHFSRFTGDVFFSRPGETVPADLKGTTVAAVAPAPSPTGGPSGPTGLSAVFNKTHGDGKQAQAIAFSGDGQFVATVESRAAHVWETATGQLVRTIDLEYDTSSGTTAVLFDSSGNRLVVTGDSGNPVNVYDTTTGARTAVADLGGRYLEHLHMDADSDRVVGLDNFGELKAVDIGSGEVTSLGRLPGRAVQGKPGRSFAMNRDGTVSVATRVDGFNEFRNLETGAILGSVADLDDPQPDVIQSVQLTPDGRTCMFRRSTNSGAPGPSSPVALLVADVGTKSIEMTLAANRSGWTGNALAPNGEWLVTSDAFTAAAGPNRATPGIHLWRVGDESGPVASVAQSSGGVARLVISPDGAFVASTDTTGGFTVWRVEGD